MEESGWETTTAVETASAFVCDQLQKNISEFLDRISARRTTTPKHVDVARVVQILVPIVALFGILGNGLNLLVLTRKSLRYTMDHLEKSAHSSLIALAVSDALICVVYTVKSATAGRFTVVYRSLLALYFDMYHEGLFNIRHVATKYKGSPYQLYARSVCDIKAPPQLQLRLVALYKCYMPSPLPSNT